MVLISGQLGGKSHGISGEGILASALETLGYKSYLLNLLGS